MAKAAKTVKDPGKQVFHLLRFYFIVAPILVGLDKFFYELCNWSVYINPFMLRVISCQDRLLMGIVGLIEIIVGIGVAFKPKLFSYIICLWLIVIIINLLMTGQYFDVALRDLGLLFAAFSLAKLSSKYAGRGK